MRKELIFFCCNCFLVLLVACSGGGKFDGKWVIDVEASKAKTNNEVAKAFVEQFEANMRVIPIFNNFSEMPINNGTLSCKVTEADVFDCKNDVGEARSFNLSLEGDVMIVAPVGLPLTLVYKKEGQYRNNPFPQRTDPGAVSENDPGAVSEVYPEVDDEPHLRDGIPEQLLFSKELGRGGKSKLWIISGDEEQNLVRLYVNLPSGDEECEEGIIDCISFEFPGFIQDSGTVKIMDTERVCFFEILSDIGKVHIDKLDGRCGLGSGNSHVIDLIEGVYLLENTVPSTENPQAMTIEFR